MKKKPLQISDSCGSVFRYGKYVVLIVILALCFMGKSGLVASNSPWTVFSRIQSFALPQIGVGLVLLILILVGMVLEKRFFCRFLCPMGAIFSLLPVLPVSAVQRDRPNCYKGCSACKRVCPANLEIADRSMGDSPEMGECFSCGKCMEICPKGHIGTSVWTGKGGVIFWNLVRGAIFAMVFILL